MLKMSKRKLSNEYLFNKKQCKSLFSRCLERLPGNLKNFFFLKFYICILFSLIFALTNYLLYWKFENLLVLDQIKDLKNFRVYEETKNYIFDISKTYFGNDNQKDNFNQTKNIEFRTIEKTFESLNIDYLSKLNLSQSFFNSTIFEQYFNLYSSNYNSKFGFILNFNISLIVIDSLIFVLLIVTFFFISKKYWVYLFHLVSMICCLNNYCNFEILRTYLKINKDSYHLEYTIPIAESTVVIFYLLLIDDNVIVNSISMIVSNFLIFSYSLGNEWKFNFSFFLYLFRYFPLGIVTYLGFKSKNDFLNYLDKIQKDLEKTKNFIHNMDIGVLILNKEITYHCNERFEDIIKSDIVNNHANYKCLNQIAVFTRIYEFNEKLKPEITKFFEKFKSIFVEIEETLKNKISDKNDYKNNFKINFKDDSFSNRFRKYNSTRDNSSKMSRFLPKKKNITFKRPNKSLIDRKSFSQVKNQDNSDIGSKIKNPNFLNTSGNLNLLNDQLAQKSIEDVERKIKTFVNFLFENFDDEKYQLLGRIKIKEKIDSFSEENIFQVYIRNNKSNQTIEFLFSDISSVIKREDNRAQNKYKKMFLNKFSHEFRNPILNISQLLKNIKEDIQDINEKSEENLNHIKNICNFMTMLISDFDFVANCDICSLEQEKQPLSNLSKEDCNYSNNKKNFQSFNKTIINFEEIPNYDNYQESYYENQNYEQEKIKKCEINGDITITNKKNQIKENIIENKILFNKRNALKKGTFLPLNTYIAIPDKNQLQKKISNFNEAESNIEKTRFDIYKMIKTLIKMFQSKIALADKFITISYEIEKLIPFKIVHDCLKLKQILFNLLSNSYKFTNNGNIILRLSKERNNLIFIISDTGIGIKQDLIEMLGIPFFKLDANNAYGIGMGLHIVKKQIELLSGEIYIQSDFGIGTTVTVRIPINPYKMENTTSMIHDKTFWEKFEFMGSSIITNDKNFNNLEYLKKKNKTHKEYISESINDKYNVNPFKLQNSLIRIKGPNETKNSSIIDNSKLNLGNSCIPSKKKINKKHFQLKKKKGFLTVGIPLHRALISNEIIGDIDNKFNHIEIYNPNVNIQRKISEYYKSEKSTEINNNLLSFRYSDGYEPQNSDSSADYIKSKNQSSKTCEYVDKNISNNIFFPAIKIEKQNTFKQSSEIKISDSRNSDKINLDNSIISWNIQMELNKNKITNENLKVTTNNSFFISAKNLYEKPNNDSKNCNKIYYNEKFDSKKELKIISDNDLKKNESQNNFNGKIKKSSLNKKQLDNLIEVGFNDKLEVNQNTEISELLCPPIFRILVVDDEKLIRQSEINVLKKYFKINKIKYEIEECVDGVECLYKLYMGIVTGKKYRMILTDETMNFMKGSTMANIIRNLINDNLLYEINIYMITSYEISSIPQKTKEDIDKIFTKPLSLSTLETIFMLENEE